MRTGRAYITSLGTTGVLVACSLLLLVVGGALLAYDRWPSSDSSGGADAIVIGAAGEPVVKTRTVAAERRAQLRADRRRPTPARATRRQPRTSAARRGVQRDVGVSRLPGGSVISNHQAPDAAGGGSGPSGAGAAGNAGANGTRGVTPQSPGQGPGRPSGLVGDTVSGISAGAGQAADGVGQRVDGGVTAPLESLSPGLQP